MDHELEATIYLSFEDHFDLESYAYFVANEYRTLGRVFKIWSKSTIKNGTIMLKANNILAEL